MTYIRTDKYNFVDKNGVVISFTYALDEAEAQQRLDYRVEKGCATLNDCTVVKVERLTQSQLNARTQKNRLQKGLVEKVFLVPASKIDEMRKIAKKMVNTHLKKLK